MAWVLLFDGDCAMCSSTVRVVARLDSRQVIGLAPLQGEFSRRHGLEVHASPLGGSLVLMDDQSGELHLGSDAVIVLARLLGWPWCLLCLGRMLPGSWRAAAYRWVADRRQRLFPRGGVCRLQDPRVIARLRD